MAETEEFIDSLNLYSEAFDKLCEIRYDREAEKDGPFQFLADNVISVLADALADVANNSRREFIKLMLLQDILDDRIESYQASQTKMGNEAFTQAGGGDGKFSSVASKDS